MPEIYHYRCSQCDKLHDSAIKMSRGSPDRKCTKTFNCAGTYGYKDMVVDHNPYKNAHFAADKVKKQAVVSAFRGRSVSAPPQADVTKLATTPTVGVIYVEDVSTSAWTSMTAKSKVRLAYASLVTTAATDVQGLVIDPPTALTGEVLLHFQQVAYQMTVNHKTADPTEATGEAAAALGMLAGGTHPGFTMLWGFHKHSGAGIDQIWGKPAGNGKYSEYVIVEAKGVGASLTQNAYAPAGLNQMAKGWVLDRLGRMSDPLAAQILKDIGVTIHVAYPNYNNGSKSYYGEKSYTKTSVKLHGIVYTAKWIAGPKLSYTASGKTTYYG